MATSLVEAQWEALFKRVEDGFIFRVPGLFPRHYLVTAAQKAKIIYSLMHPKLIILFIFGIGLFFLAVLLAVLLAVPLGDGNVGATIPVIGLYVALISVPIRFVRATRSRQIGRVLEGARQTEQRITLRDRNKTYARLLPLSMLLAAGVGCALGSALNVMIATQASVASLQFGDPQHQLTNQVVGLFGLVPFALLAVCFFYLAFLKLSLGRSA
jgi:hypothetical protein